MNRSPATLILSKQPGACLVMAVLFAAMGALLFFDVLPTSPNRLSAHRLQWAVEVLCAGGACFFLHCARVGFRQQSASKRQAP